MFGRKITITLQDTLVEVQVQDNLMGHSKSLHKLKSRDEFDVLFRQLDTITKRPVSKEDYISDIRIDIRQFIEILNNYLK